MNVFSRARFSRSSGGKYTPRTTSWGVSRLCTTMGWRIAPSVTTLRGCSPSCTGCPTCRRWVLPVCRRHPKARRTWPFRHSSLPQRVRLVYGRMILFLTKYSLEAVDFFFFFPLKAIFCLLPLFKTPLDFRGQAPPSDDFQPGKPWVLFRLRPQLLKASSSLWGFPLCHQRPPLGDFAESPGALKSRVQSAHFLAGSHVRLASCTCSSGPGSRPGCCQLPDGTNGPASVCGSCLLCPSRLLLS